MSDSHLFDAGTARSSAHVSRSWLQRAAQGSTVARCCLLIVLSVSLGGCGDRERNVPGHDSLERQASDGELSVDPGEAPSPTMVGLAWNDPERAVLPVASLDFELENRLDSKLEVTITAVSQGPESDVAEEVGRVELGPNETRPYSLGVDQLPVQLVGSSVPTIVGARFTAPDGQERGVVLPTRYVTHQLGYETATVRTFRQEAAANAALSMRDLAALRPSEGRILEAGRPRALTAPSGAVQSRLVSFAPKDLPRFDPETAQPFPENDTDEQVEKSGNYNICLKLPYMYIDAHFGEDYLKNGYTPSTVGYERARYMGAILVASNGNSISGYLNSSGCTGNLYHSNGNYTAYVVSIVDRGGSDDHRFEIWPTYDDEDESNYTYWSVNYSVSGSGGTKNLNAAGSGEISNVALVASMAVHRSTNAWRGSFTNIYTEEFCGPSNDPTTCADHDNRAIYLNGKVYWKYVIAHEIGHRVSTHLYGEHRVDYGDNSIVPLVCMCNHVTSEPRHCIQSREYISTAQFEGFAQFFAAKTFNNGKQSSCAFVYYKEYKDPTGAVFDPPIQFHCGVPWRWMETFCNGSDRGVELDWMTFYWWLKEKEGFTWANWEDIYEGACGGTCTPADDPSWSDLQDAVADRFGSSSTKYADFNTYGDSYGVDH